MKRIKMKLSLMVAGAFLALAAVAPKAHADDPHNVAIHVSISGAKLLTVANTYYNFGALGISVSSVSAAELTVTNASTVFIETYTITGANAISQVGGGTDWTLAASTGNDTFALSAQFSDARPTDSDAAWANDALNNATPVTASATVLGNGTEAEGGSRVLQSEVRKLWFRIKTPGAVTDSAHHIVTAVLAVY